MLYIYCMLIKYNVKVMAIIYKVRGDRILQTFLLVGKTQGSLHLCFISSFTLSFRGWSSCSKPSLLRLDEFDLSLGDWTWAAAGETIRYIIWKALLQAERHCISKVNQWCITSMINGSITHLWQKADRMSLLQNYIHPVFKSCNVACLWLFVRGNGWR